MKLLKEFEYESDAETLIARLRRAGVLAVALNRGASNLSGATASAVKVAVWVVIDEQFDDAYELLRNKCHPVKNPLTEEQMVQLANEAAITHSSLPRYLMAAAVFSVALIVAAYLLPVL